MQENALREDRAHEALEARSPSAGLPAARVIQRREQKRAAERGRAVGRGRAEGAEDGRQEPVPDCFHEVQSGLLQDSVIASAATKQSSAAAALRSLDCFAPLAMTTRLD